MIFIFNFFSQDNFCFTEQCPKNSFSKYKNRDSTLRFHIFLLSIVFADVKKTAGRPSKKKCKICRKQDIIIIHCYINNKSFIKFDHFWIEICLKISKIFYRDFFISI